MENIYLDTRNNSNKTCLKHRRSHSIGFPVHVDRVFWNQVRTNIKMEYFITTTDKTEKHSTPVSSKMFRLYSPQKPHSSRRKSMDFKELDQKIMEPLMHTFEKLVVYEEEKHLKIKLSTLKALQKSDEDRLDRLILENKDLKNKLENLNFETLKINNEIKNTKHTNESLEDRNKCILNELRTMKVLFEDNENKLQKINSIEEVTNKIKNYDYNILKLHENIAQLQNQHYIAKKQYDIVQCNILEAKKMLLKQTQFLVQNIHVNTNYLNYLKNESNITNNELIEYLDQNKNLKLKCNELSSELVQFNNNYNRKNKLFKVIANLFLNIFLY